MLLPCPFCGGRATVVREGTPRQSSIVECEYCGCRLESNEQGAGYYWNLRYKGCLHEIGIDGAHSNEYCKLCFRSKEDIYAY